VLDELVLRPIGMTHSTYEQPLPRDRWSTAATPYDESGLPIRGGWRTYPEMAPAGLWTTPSDLAQFAIEIQKEYAGRSNRILSTEMIHEMVNPQKDDWGLGFAVHRADGELRFGHSGSNAGFECDLEAYAKLGQGIVIMTNGQQGLDLIGEFLRAVAKEYGWPDFRPREHTLVKINPEVLRGYVGVYEIPGEGTLAIALKGNQLYVQADPLGPDPEELLPESKSEFFILSQNLMFAFRKDDKGVIRMTLRGGSRVLDAKKVR
jgi:beta-lactamase family protein/uncharacterized protein DUF3471